MWGPTKSEWYGFLGCLVGGGVVIGVGLAWLLGVL